MSAQSRTVLVTGASSGFGAAIVRRFLQGSRAKADEQYRVIAAARRMDRLAELAKETGALPVELDVRDKQAIAATLEDLPEEYKRIHVLVNNAGLAAGLDPAQSADLADWEQMIDTNCTGLAYMTRAVLPAMVKNHSGHIINLGSVAGTYPYPGSNVYGATKAFVHTFSLNLRSDLHGTGVRVTSVEPGLSGGTEFSTVRFHGDEQKAAAVYDRTHALEPEDIAEAVFWAANQPAHVNINVIEMMPTVQSFAPFQVDRTGNA